MDLMTFGTLVALAKTIVDTLKGVDDLLSRRLFFGAGPAKVEVEKLKENVRLFYQRLDTLTAQLEKSQSLVTSVEAWLQVIRHMSIPSSLDKSSDDEAKGFREDLSQFLTHTNNDYFRHAFFGTDFQQFPDVEDNLKVFRSNLEQVRAKVDRDIMLPQSITVFKGQWTGITAQLNDLRNSGLRLRDRASQIRDQLNAWCEIL